MKIKHKVVVFPDIHFPNEDKKAFSCALNVIKAVEPTAFLLIGDFADGESVSHWQWSKKKRPPTEYQLPSIYKEIEDVNSGLDKIDNVLEEVGCNKKILAQGNHELWFDNFVTENPYLPEIGSRKAFKIDERGYEWHPYGEVFKVLGSKLYAYHGGHYMGIAHARTHALHLGCLTDMSKSYLKGRPTNWSHNVAVLDIFTNNNFNLVVLDIVNGTTSYGGDVISA